MLPEVWAAIDRGNSAGARAAYREAATFFQEAGAERAAAGVQARADREDGPR